MGCYITDENGIYTIGNEKIERSFYIEEGKLVTDALLYKKSMSKMSGANDEFGETFYEGLNGRIRGKVERFSSNLINVKRSCQVTEAELTFVFYDDFRQLTIEKTYFVYLDLPIVKTSISIITRSFPLGDFYEKRRYNVADSVPVPKGENQLVSFEFFTRTDNTNHLVEEKKSPKAFDRGNLLFLQNNSVNMILLKESPCFKDQRPECEGNFYISENYIDFLGFGIMPDEFILDEKMQSYGYITGFFDGDMDNGIRLLKDYQEMIAPKKPQRDYMVLVNPWGEGNLYAHSCEQFVLDELAASNALGATHYQLDDGWESGNLVEILDNVYQDKNFWDINKELFPSGFESTAKYAKEQGLQFALWFCPGFEVLYRNWEWQAEILFNLYQTYGIKTFKIDGMNLRRRECEYNLESLFKNLKERSNGEIVFNMDTTANPRPGYFMFHQYGNIFLENRYSFGHCHNYYPHQTLQNLWNLSRFVPAQKLQIEFLNIDKGSEFYDKEDKLAPINYSHEYVTAVTLFANPLCWFAPSLAAEDTLKKYCKVLELHKKYREDIFSGQIYPILSCPNGYSFTGFQSHNFTEKTGYIIVYRENTENESVSLDLKFLKEKSFQLESLYQEHKIVTVNCYNQKNAIVTLKEPKSFELYRYKLLHK